MSIGQLREHQRFCCLRKPFRCRKMHHTGRCTRHAAFTANTKELLTSLDGTQQGDEHPSPLSPLPAQPRPKSWSVGSRCPAARACAQRSPGWAGDCSLWTNSPRDGVGDPNGGLLPFLLPAGLGALGTHQPPDSRPQGCQNAAPICRAGDRKTGRNRQETCRRRGCGRASRGHRHGTRGQLGLLAALPVTIREHRGSGRVGR